jgi:hypothetical protein
VVGWLERDAGRATMRRAARHFLGREYWGLAFGPALACFAPAGLDYLRASTRARN